MIGCHGGKLREVYQRMEEFQKALLGLVNVEPLDGNNIDATSAVLLFAGNDGQVYESFLNLENAIAMGGRALSDFSAGDLTSEDGKTRLMQRYNSMGVYIATTPSKITPPYDLGRHASRIIAEGFDKRHPDIVKKRNSPQEQESGIAGTVIGLAMNMMPLVTSCKKPETILAMEHGKNPVESYYKINCAPCEFHDGCSVYAKLHETYGQKPAQKNPPLEKMNIPPPIIPRDPSLN